MPEDQPSWVPVEVESSASGPEVTAPVPGSGAVAVQGEVVGALPKVASGGEPSDGHAPTVSSGATALAYRFDDTLTIPTTTVAGSESPAFYDGNTSGLVGEDDPWPSHAARRGIHLKVPTAVLGVLLIAAGAFWGGAAVQKSRGGSAGSAGTGAAASRFRSLFGAAGATGSSAGGSSRTGASGAASLFRGAFGASTAAATGEFTAKVGNTIYVTTSAGTLVKVVVGSTTKVTRDATASVSALKQGDTVVVEGSTAKDGTVTATSITATASGVSSGGAGGGFAGGGAGG